MIVGEVMGDTKSVKAKNQRLRTLGNRKEMKGSSEEKKEQKEYINLAKNRQNIEKEPKHVRSEFQRQYGWSLISKII